MGHAFLGGLLRSGWAAPGELGVVEPLATAREELVKRYPGIVVSERGIPAEAAPSRSQAAGGSCPLPPG
jgi:pyrroline-5-carboxylate reductase